MSKIFGFDAGTYNLVVCNRNEKGDFVYKREINAFLEIPLEYKFVFNMMKKSGVPMILREDKSVAYALGEAAIEMAYTMPQIDLRRPMKDGCVNPQEKDAWEILNIMMHSLLGEVQEDNCVLYYSVPANAINAETDAVFHGKLLDKVFKGYKSEKGYKVKAFPIPEGLTLVYAELQNKMFTGIGISCLCPKTKIYTKRGITNIEDVVIGDEVITHKGRWKKVFNIIEKKFSGKATKVKIGNQAYDFVDNHNVYVKRNNQWQWIGCEEIEVGDIVGEPILQYNGSPSPKITIEDKITSSSIIHVNEITVNSEIQRLIGYFLGDGSTNKAEGCLQFDFNVKENEYIEDVRKILKEQFNKESSITKKGDKCVRVKCYSRGLMKWFRDNCYNGKLKTYPWTVSQLTDSDCLNLITGMIRSDGYTDIESVRFGNTNSELIVLVRQCFSRLNMPAGIYCRKPRTGGQLVDGRFIEGKLPEWSIAVSQGKALSQFNEFVGNINRNYAKKGSRRYSIQDGYLCNKVNSLEYYDYEGIVYDLQVEDDHSFSGPNLIIKNCGAGMINVSFANFGAPIFNFSIVNSGDWIDKQAAKATNESVAVINKEKTKIDLTKQPTSVIERAIMLQYEAMIDTTVVNIKKGLMENKNAKLDHPVDVIVAGGTSSPKGFEQLFKERLLQQDLPIEIGSVIKPADPLFSVARGCLIAAENHQ